MVKKLLLLKIALLILPNTFVFAQTASDTIFQRNKHIQTQITDCNLPAIKELQKGNLFYSFVLDENGKATDITNVRDLNDSSRVTATVKSCIENWEMKGFPPKSRFAAFFEWRSEKGWVEQKISGAGFSYDVKTTALSKYVKPSLEKQMTISFCDLEAPKNSVSKNDELLLSYSFQLNKRGKISKIKEISNDYIKDDIKSCISSWNIKGFPAKSIFTASFKWKNEIGWNVQTISGKNFEQSIVLEIDKK